MAATEGKLNWASHDRSEGMWLANGRKGTPAPRWAVLDGASHKSAGGATITKLNDGSLLVGGKNPTQETLTLSTLLLDGAEVLRLAGRHEDEAVVLREAIRVSEQKGATVLVRRAEERLSRLAPSPGLS